jgi:hypothetical protein
LQIVKEHAARRSAHRGAEGRVAKKRNYIPDRVFVNTPDPSRVRAPGAGSGERGRCAAPLESPPPDGQRPPARDGPTRATRL